VLLREKLTGNSACQAKNLEWIVSVAGKSLLVSKKAIFERKFLQGQLFGLEYGLLLRRVLPGDRSKGCRGRNTYNKVSTPKKA